jgi:hypothetical protein
MNVIKGEKTKRTKDWQANGWNLLELAALTDW